MPARIIWPRTLGELEAGPIVQTIFVAILAGIGRASLPMSKLRRFGLLIRLIEVRPAERLLLFSPLIGNIKFRVFACDCSFDRKCRNYRKKRLPYSTIYQARK